MYKQTILQTLIFLMLINLTNCFEITDKSTVHRNGSITKTIVFRDDSTSIKKMIAGEEETALNIPKDNRWRIAVDIDKTDSTKMIYTATQKFKNAEQLNAAIQMESDTVLKINPIVTLDKKFRWFYSYYYFKETYSYFGFKKYVDIHEYLSEDDLQMYYIDSDSSGVEDIIEIWMQKNVGIYFQVEFTKLLKQLDDPTIKIEKYSHIEDTLMTCVESAIELNDLGEMTHKILEITQNYYDADVSSIQQPLQDLLFGLQRISASIFSMIGEFNVVVEMPGIILSTNSNIIEGNSVKWQFNHDRFALEDFSMVVESRALNKWAIYLTVILIAGWIAIIFFNSKK